MLVDVNSTADAMLVVSGSNWRKEVARRLEKATPVSSTVAEEPAVSRDGLGDILTSTTRVVEGNSLMEVAAALLSTD